MNLGIISAPFAESFEKAKKIGVEAVEFDMNEGVDLDAFEDRLPELKRESEKWGIGVSILGRWGAVRQTADGEIVEAQRAADHRLIDFCAYLNCPVFVCNINYAQNRTLFENYRTAIEYFGELIEYGREKGVKIATYNCPWEAFVVTEEQWKVVHGHLTELGIKFDPANSTYNGSDLMQEAAHWGNRFYHVHLKGHIMMDGGRLDDPPAGMDDTNWPAFIAILVARGYKGNLSIEPHSENWNGERGEKGVAYTVKYFNNLLFD